MKRFLGHTLGGLMSVAVGATGQAATVESYDVKALARIWLKSATFDDGSDASGALSISYLVDGFDDFPQSFGNASVVTDFTRDDATGTFAVETSGVAGPPVGSSTGRIGGYLFQTFLNTSNLPISLAFDYEISGNGSASGGIGDYDFNAFVELHSDNAMLFGAEIGTFDALPFKTGMTGATFGAGEKLYTYSNASAFGTAFAFAPVPLPGSLPILGIGLGSLAALGWRTRRRRGAQGA